MSEQPPEECPNCGSEIVQVGGTQAYTTYSCVECVWHDRFKAGSYL